MPLYIVRWPAFNVSLVRARNEQELIDILDEVADPGSCRWAVYKGPVFIDLDLPVSPVWGDDGPSPLSDSDVELQGVDDLRTDESLFEVSISEGDTGSDMKRAIAKWAFPVLTRTIESSDALVPTREALVRALRAELREMIQYHWRAAHLDRRDDRETAILQILGLTVAPPWLKSVMEQAANAPRGEPTSAIDQEEPPPSDDPDCPF